MVCNKSFWWHEQELTNPSERRGLYSKEIQWTSPISDNAPLPDNLSIRRSAWQFLLQVSDEVYHRTYAISNNPPRSDAVAAASKCDVLRWLV